MTKHQKTAFGEYLVQEIKKAGMSQEAFYKAVGITKPYFYDLLKSAPPHPGLQKKMIAVLENQTGEDKDRRERLINLAAQGRQEIPADIKDYLLDHPDKWAAVRALLFEMNADGVKE